MNSPFQEIFPTPGLKGVNGDTTPQKLGSPGGMNTPFQDGTVNINATKDGNFPTNFQVQMPSQGTAPMNSPFESVFGPDKAGK